MLSVIFLDIDGVMQGWQGMPGRKMAFGPEPVKALNSLLAAVPHASIVISSSWRTCFDLFTIADFFRSQGVEGARIIGQTPSLNHSEREEEVLYWFKQHQCLLDSYVVIDDWVDGFPKIRADKRFVQVRMSKGLDLVNARHAERILRELL